MRIFVIMNMQNTIKSLLYRYDCVIVPDFGGFVAKRNSAVFHPIDYRFDPPKKVVGFNSDLIHTDGLLANEFAKQNNLTYNEAIEFIENEVADWKKTLEDTGSFSIPELGTFRLSNSIIEFHPDENQNFALDSFGLSPLRGEYILRKEEQIAPSKKANVWVSYAAAIGFALLVGSSSFLANQNLVQNQLSSFLPLLNDKSVVETPNEVPVAPVIDLNSIDNNENINSKLVTETTSEETYSSDATASTEGIDLSVKKYQVIGGSFKVYSRAMEHQAKLIRQGYDRAIIVGKVGNFYMVAYDTFNDETEAAEYKKSLEKLGKDVFMRP